MLDPIAATEWGLPGPSGALPDYSPSGRDQIARLSAQMLHDLDTIRPLDAVDRVTASAMRDRLGAELALHQAGEDSTQLNNIASPIQDVRDSFDLMPKRTREDWVAIGSRLRAVTDALAGYELALREGAAHGRIAARRQVRIGIEQCRDLADPDGFFATLVRGAAPAVGGDDALASGLLSAARSAARAYGHLAEFLRDALLNVAPQTDGVGRERYALFSHEFVGARVDLDETYLWGLDELARIDAQERKLAATLYGSGTSVRDALRRLNADPARQLSGTDALQKWMQGLADQAIGDLDGTEFDIPEPARRIECLIAPTHDGGIYYTSPSEDFSRPGRMWWSVPEGETMFHVWQERTTVFHEGVPGHHLQISQALVQRDTLNLWRRLASWNSGHGEGWALYAEQLMADLGYQDDPGDRMGVLDSERLRAARVVLDIGVHLGKRRPEGGGTWDRDYAWDFLKRNVAMADGFLLYELNRYLGWPGQSPAYKIGQRLWEQARDAYLATAAQRGEQPTLKAFHTKALALGSVPMSTLHDAVLDRV